jgi:hypothetical protein
MSNAKYLLTDKEIERLWLTYEKNDPYQKTDFSVIVDQAQLNKCIRMGWKPPEECSKCYYKTHYIAPPIGIE